MAWGTTRPKPSLPHLAAQRFAEGHMLHHVTLTIGPGTADLLEGIEREGWRLEHVGYVFQPRNDAANFDFVNTFTSNGGNVGMFTFRRATA